MATNLLGSDKITQVGLTVPDIEAAVKAWSTLLGVDPPEIIITSTVEDAHTRHNGQPTSARAKLAFFHLGQVDLELIEPVGEPSTWNDNLVEHGPSLHHIAFQIKGMADTIATLDAQGIPLVQSGDYEGGRYAYMDGQKSLGAVLELLEND
jgi:methylmalonyl-CoA/ethylmalonyl-CoA epimerase